jgi:hypothetical protein
MSRIFPARCQTGILFLWLVLALPLPVFASQAPVQIKLSVSQASPGATIEVAGGRFPEDAMVKFVMQNSENQISLGTVLADDHGEFSVPVLIPLDLPYGEYEFQAIDDTNQMAKAPIAIIPDTGGQEGNDQREASDGLAAPMPTFAPGALSTPVPQTTALEPSASKGNPTILIYSILAAVGILALLSIKVLKKR